MDEKIKNLIDYGMFVVSEKAEVTRHSLHQWLVEYALFMENKPMNKNEVQEKCTNLLELNTPFPEEHILNGINLSLNAKHIEINNEKKYYIVAERIKQIQDDNNQFKIIEQNFNDFITAKIIESAVKEIDNIILNKILDVIKEEVLRKFSLITLNAANTLLSNGNIFEDEVEEDSNLEKNIRIVLEKFDVSKLVTEKIVHSIINVFTNLPSELLPYLNILLLNIYHSQILKIDPNISNFEKEKLKERKIFLDTNVLIPYFLDSHRNSDLVRTMVELSKNFGVKLCVFENTLQEFKSNIDRSKRTYNYLLKNQARNKALAIRSDDAFLAEFASKTDSDWDLYINIFSNTESLLESVGIEVCPNAEIDGENCTRVMSVLEDLKSFNNIEDNLTTINKRVEHDISFFCSLHNEREIHKNDLLGNKVWGLTYDNSLVKLQRNKDVYSLYPKPVIRTCDEWLTILIGFKNPVSSHTSKENYLKFLASSIVNKSSLFINSSVFDLFSKLSLPIGSFINMMEKNSALAINTLNAMAENRELKSFQKEVMENGPSEELSQRIEKVFAQTINKVLEEDKGIRSKIENQNKELDKLERSNTKKVEENSFLKEEIENFKKENDEKEKRIEKQNKDIVDLSNEIIRFRRQNKFILTGIGVISALVILILVYLIY